MTRFSSNMPDHRFREFTNFKGTRKELKGKKKAYYKQEAEREEKIRRRSRETVR